MRKALSARKITTNSVQIDGKREVLTLDPTGPLASVDATTFIVVRGVVVVAVVAGLEGTRAAAEVVLFLALIYFLLLRCMFVPCCIH